MKYSSRFLIAGAFALSAFASATQAQTVVFDNVTAPIANNTVTGTSSSPNTFLGSAYTLAAGTTSISGFDLFPANLTTSSTYAALKLNLWVWGTVNTGAVSAASPAFSNLLGSYSFTSTGSFGPGFFFPLEGEDGEPGVSLSSPLAIGGTTIGVTVNVQGSTDGVTFANVQNVTSLISYGTPATVGSLPFNGYYRNAAGETNGNFTSGVRSLGFTDQALGMRIYGTVTAVPEPGTWALMGLGLAAVAFIARRRRA